MSRKRAYCYAIRTANGWLQCPASPEYDPHPSSHTHYVTPRIERRTLFVDIGTALDWVKYLEQCPDRVGPFVHPQQPSIVSVIVEDGFVGNALPDDVEAKAFWNTGVQP